jgi:hypothetical protein
MAVKAKNTKTASKNISDIDTPLEAVSEEILDADIHYKTLLVGLAKSLSPKSNSRIGFELALNTEDKARYLRLTSNTNGGLFSKSWTSLDVLFELLEQQEEDKPFKSSIFKTVIKGGSANNVSFLAAVCRCEEMGLILKSEKNQFLHLVNPLLINQRDRLTKLKPLPTSAKK